LEGRQLRLQMPLSQAEKADTFKCPVGVFRSLSEIINEFPKNEAFSKETDLKSTFPELSTYVKYNAPFWRLRVGDFQTYQDAQNMLVQLRHNFPAFGREMSIVKEKIQVKVQ